jgi:hypothetical protein
MAWLRNPSGPRVVVRPVDADTVVSTWRAARRAAADPAVPLAAPPPAPRWSWFPFRRRRAA